MTIILNGTTGITTPGITNQGVVEFTAGSVGAPSLTTTSDTNTGIYFPAADTIAFTEGGVESMRIDAAANVGIGVTPSAWTNNKALEIGSVGNGFWGFNSTEFNVFQNSYYGSGFKYAGTGLASRYEQNAGKHAWYTAATGTAGDTISFTQAMTLNASGNLGIGTTSPSTILNIGTSSTVNPTVRLNQSQTGGSDTAMYSFGIDNTADFAGMKFDFTDRATKGLEIFCATGYGYPMSFSTSGASQAMFISSTGDVGIGTTSITGRVQVKGNASGGVFITESTDATATYGYLGVSHFTNGAFIGTYAGSDAAADILRLGTGGTERCRITSGGDFFIGTTNGGGRLSVKEAANLSEADSHIHIEGNGYSGYHWLDGTAYYIGHNSASRALRIYSSDETAGVNLAAGGTSWGTFSDERLKYDVEPITDGLTKLANVRCVSYRLKDVDAKDSQKKLGLIAQDLVGVVDDVIDITKRTGDNTDYMSVRYTELIPVLVKAIQELSAKVTALESK